MGAWCYTHNCPAQDGFSKTEYGRSARGGNKGIAGRLAKSAQDIFAPGPGRVRGGTCVEGMANVTLEKEEAFEIEGGDLCACDLGSQDAACQFMSRISRYLY